MLTTQEIYERAVRGLDGQGWKKSVDEVGSCMYRGINGLKCAVGHIIDDDIAKEWDNGEEFSGVSGLSDSTLADAGLPPASRPLLGAMQIAHDRSHGPEDMYQKMHVLAERFDVTWPEDCKEV